MVQSRQSFGAGQGGFRQAQSWLHTWCGLWFSWLLFAVFLTGTLAVFEESISHWMTPEHHADEAKAADAQASVPAVSLSQRLQWGLAYMERHHPGATMWELWPADPQGGGDLRVYWFDAKGQYAAAQLDPLTGEELKAQPGARQRQTLGGHHFVTFHYELHAGQIGLWIVGAAALAMLVALVSGVITHRRIFKDFFTFRPHKGQRSWLDAHNAVAVLTLPFQLVIAYTGLALSSLTFLPAGMVTYFGADEAARKDFVTRLNEPGKPQRSGQPMAVPNLEPLVLRGQKLMGQPVRAVVVDYPGDAAARVGVYGWNDPQELRRRLSPTTGMVMFSAASSEVLQLRQPGGVEGGSPALTQSVIGSLHMVNSGGLLLKWLYFVCGMAGSAMMATGAILFVVKRRGKHLTEFGGASAKVYRLIEGLNVAAIAGLGIACIGYLWANRLVPLGLTHRDDWELAVFFVMWLLALVHAWLRPPALAWRQQMALLAALCLLLPVLNVLTTGDQLLAYVQEGDWESAGVELTVVAFGLAAAAAWHRMRRAPAITVRNRRNVTLPAATVTVAAAEQKGLS
ncbi:PepSY-associated TM helix domain-containing protein [Comamonas sp. 4034]|uniref:PepSY-associated TM helix domain-containing protein n=1 Tax=Comamonas sp. 4034 TaxID=3156455 RepID=UPI003D1EFA3C